MKLPCTSLCELSPSIASHTAFSCQLSYIYARHVVTGVSYAGLLLGRDWVFHLYVSSTLLNQCRAGAQYTCPTESGRLVRPCAPSSHWRLSRGHSCGLCTAPQQSECPPRSRWARSSAGPAHTMASRVQSSPGKQPPLAQSPAPTHPHQCPSLTSVKHMLNSSELLAFSPCS